jgi:hypothetical protein
VAVAVAYHKPVWEELAGMGVPKPSETETADITLVMVMVLETKLNSKPL